MASSTCHYSHSAFPLKWKDLAREPYLYRRELEKKWMINRASLTLAIKPGLDCSLVHFVHRKRLLYH